MEESAKTIGSKGVKISEARNNKGRLKQSHGRDSGTPTAVTLGSSQWPAKLGPRSFNFIRNKGASLGDFKGPFPYIN